MSNTILKLPNGRTITFNDQQEAALNKIRDWLQNPKDLLFTLNGYAGTGKTTIVLEALKRAPHPIAVTAPTHKAKKVISSATNKEGVTIQSLLGLLPNTDLAEFDINNPQFAVKRAPTINEYKLVLIDESSMLNKELFEMLLRQSSMYDVKLLFMGDEAQLPPINEDISLVFSSPKIVNRYNLTHVERQSSDNPLMPIYSTIRNNQDSREEAFELTSQLVGEDQKGLEVFPNLMDFGREAVKAFSSKSFTEDANYCKLLCFTNARNSFWNRAIRKALIQNYVRSNPPTEHNQEIYKHNEILIPGELLMAYSTTKTGLSNSAEYVISQIRFETISIGYGYKREESVDVGVFEVKLTDVDELETLDACIIHPDRHNAYQFALANQYFLDTAKRTTRWSEYYKFKEKYLLLENIMATSGAVLIKKDLDYSYAITIHKSQGSTYTRVFMDMPDVNSNRDVVVRNKLKYVAMSRPTNSVHLFYPAA